MSITFVQGRGNNESSGSHSFAYSSPNIAGNLLVAIYGEENSVGSITGVSDSQGNTWVILPQQSNGHVSRAAYCLNCKAGSNTVSFTVSGSFSNFGEMTIGEFNLGGGPGSTLDQSAQSTSSSPSVTTLAAIELVLGLVDGSNVNPRAGAGWTDVAPGQRTGIIYQIESSTGTYTPAYLNAGNTEWNTLSFKPTAIPPPPVGAGGVVIIMG